MYKFTVSSDSTCDLQVAFCRQNGVKHVPLTFTIEDKQGNLTDYLDQFEEFSQYQDFYNQLRNGSYSRTVMLNYDYHYNHFLKMAQEGAKDVVHFTISTGLARTVTVARQAFEDLKAAHPEFEDFRVFAVDSLTATIGQGIEVLMAIDMRNAGKTAQETYDYITSKRQNIQHYVLVDDLYYLKRGGRVSAASAVAGSILKIKPFITFTPEGKLEVVDKCRGTKKAYQTVIDKITAFPPTAEHYMTVVHTDAEDAARELAALIEQKTGYKPQIAVMGPVIGSHVGPGAVAVGYVSEKTRADFMAQY